MGKRCVFFSPPHKKKKGLRKPVLGFSDDLFKWWVSTYLTFPPTGKSVSIFGKFK